MLEGVSNSGKTKFIKRLSKIFPCEEYLQQHNSRFDADYRFNCSYDFTKVKPSFIVIDEGAYSALFDNADLGDTKEFFEGKGKCLQLKNVNTTGR